MYSSKARRPTLLHPWHAASLAAVCLITFAGCRPSPQAPPQVWRAADVRARAERDAALDDLLRLMRARLLLMHEVAKWKWNEGRPITDPERERQLLAELDERGLAYGLHRERTRAFMEAQIAAGKLIQEADFSAWRAEERGKFRDARDLKTDLRPAIDNVSDKLLAQLAKLPSTGDGLPTGLVGRLAGSALRGDGLNESVRAVAIGPLLH